MIERFERFSYAMFEASKHWHKLAADEMAAYDLKGTHCTYLLALFRSQSGLTAPQICELCGKDKSDVSRMMKILESKEMVFKTSDHQNRYGGIYQLTEKGTKAAMGVCAKASRAVEIAGKDLTNEQRTIFYESLESIVNNLRQMSKDGIPDDETMI